MFKSINLIAYLDDMPQEECLSLYKIRDDDFEEECVGPDVNAGADCLVKIYKNRNLNVASNFIRFLIFSKPNHWSVQKLYSDFKKDCPFLDPYREEIERYLLLV
jgi:hypothetical protein